MNQSKKPFNSTHLAVPTETPLLMQAQCAPAHLQSTRTPVPAAAAAAAADEGNHDQRLCERSRRSLRVFESYAGRSCCCLRASRQWRLLFLVGNAGSSCAHPLSLVLHCIRAAVVLRVPLVVVVVVALATNTSHHCSLSHERKIDDDDRRHQWPD